MELAKKFSEIKVLFTLDCGHQIGKLSTFFSLKSFEGSYKYGGQEYKASASPSGSNIEECQSVAIKALKVNDTCTHMQCTFGGVWNGGGGDGQKNMFVASFFFDRAAEVLLFYNLVA